MQTKVFVFLVLLSLFPAAALAVPGQIAHQGHLSDSTGPVTEQLEMTFRLYDAETGGTAVWTETQSLNVVDGHYSVLLGPDGDAGSQLPAVFLQEPALFLEVTIGTEAPLLPRQAIASVPYAVAAGTAESVSGGSVDASEVRVGGVTIIDNSGNWIGPAITSGTPDWTNITGLPSDLSDGDADTLGALSCQDGEPATWSASSSQWLCGGLVVELDWLDTQGASQDQVLTFDGSQPGWSSPGAVAGCTLTPQSSQLALLDCGGTEVRVSVLEEFIDTVGSSVQLRANGTIKTAGTGHPPTGTFTALGGAISYPCAIDSAGGIHCWRYNHLSGGLALAAPPQGSYTKVRCDGVTVCCALATSQTVACWSPDGSAVPVTNSPAGTFLDFTLSSYAVACGITTTGSVQCWGDQNASSTQSNAPAASNFELIAVRAGNFCAVGSLGGEAWTRHGNTSFDGATLPAGSYVGLHVPSGGRCLGLLNTGEIVTSDGSYVAGDFLALEHADHGCGVTTDGTLRCGL